MTFFLLIFLRSQCDSSFGSRSRVGCAFIVSRISLVTLIFRDFWCAGVVSGNQILMRITANGRRPVCARFSRFLGRFASVFISFSNSSVRVYFLVRYLARAFSFRTSLWVPRLSSCDRSFSLDSSLRSYRVATHPVLTSCTDRNVRVMISFGLDLSAISVRDREFGYGDLLESTVQSRFRALICDSSQYVTRRFGSQAFSRVLGATGSFSVC